MSVIVWGNVEDTLVDLNVTTIDQPDLEAAGAKMVEMLQELVAGAEPAALQVLWETRLIQGATVGPCPP